MTEIDAVDLDALEALLAKATPAPWKDFGRSVISESYDDVIGLKTVGGPWMQTEELVLSDEDRAAIVALHNVGPALIAGVRRLRAAAERLKRFDMIERVFAAHLKRHAMHADYAGEDCAVCLMTMGREAVDLFVGGPFSG